MEGVTIQPDGKGRLLVTLPSAKVRVEPIKRIVGRRWIPDAKLWSVPDTPDTRQALAKMFTTPPPPEPTAEHIAVTPPKPGQRPVTKPRTPFVSGGPLTTHPPHPLIKAVDDELVLRGMAYGIRKSYGQHLRNYPDWLKVKPEDATREDIRACLVQMATSGHLESNNCGPKD